MADTAHVKGLAELQKFMDELTPKLERNVMRGALRAGMNTVLPVAKANLEAAGSVESGQLRDGLKVGTSARGSTVRAYVRVKGPHSFIAQFVEYGTAAHVISGKNAGWLSFGGLFARAVDHPGAKAKPFMRPALDSQAQTALVAAAEYMKARLATKHGLDTSDIAIEAGE